MRERINILVHSEPKSGKSTFAVRRNPGVLVLDTEGSTKFVRGVKREIVKDMGQMDAVLARIKSGEVNLVVIDTLDELVNNFAKEEVRRKGGDYVYKGQLTQPGWGLMRDRFLTLTRAYRDAGADVLTLCHSELVEKPNAGKKWTMKLPSDYAREVMGMMDLIGFLEVHRNADGTQVRRMNFEKTPMYDAGSRSVYDAAADKFYRIVPASIDDPALVDVLKAYDDFFDGKNEGFAVKCSNCAKKGLNVDAKEEVEGQSYCSPCADKWRELSKEKK